MAGWSTALYRRGVTMFSDLLRTDRERAGLTVEQAAGMIGVSPALYRALEAGGQWPDWAAGPCPTR